MNLSSDSLKCITQDPDFCHGQPCIRHLRYPVTNLLELIARGMTFEDILSDYEDLELEDLQAALAFAVNAVKQNQYSVGD